MISHTYTLFFCLCFKMRSCYVPVFKMFPPFTAKLLRRLLLTFTVSNCTHLVLSSIHTRQGPVLITLLKALWWPLATNTRGLSMHILLLVPFNTANHTCFYEISASIAFQGFASYLLSSCRSEQLLASITDSYSAAVLSASPCFCCHSPLVSLPLFVDSLDKPTLHYPF
jgi:hypothetical protein